MAKKADPHTVSGSKTTGTVRRLAMALRLLAPGAVLAVVLWLVMPDRETYLQRLDLRALQREARANPNDPEVFLMLGRRLRQRGDRYRAGVMVRRAYDVSRGDPRTTAARIGASIDAAEYAEAEQRVAEAVARWPASGEVRAQQSRLYAERGLFVDALREAREAVRLAPDRAEAWQALGNALARNKLPADAAFRKALAREPEDGELLADTGEALMRLGRAEEAEGMLARAVAAAPRGARPAALLGQLKATRARTAAERAAARALLEQAAARAPRAAHLRYHLGLLAARDGRHAEAIRRLTECLALDPSYGEAHLALGQVYREMSREADGPLPPEARRAFAAWQRFSDDRREVAHLTLRLQRAPGDAALLRRLAALHAAAGRTREADAVRQRLRAMTPGAAASKQPQNSPRP